MNVPAAASYITGASVEITVSASKVGYTAPGDVTRTLTVDLTAPTAPTWTAPPSLQVGVAITAILPNGGSGIDEYSAAGLPAGLSIDPSTGVISGTPEAADTSTAAVTVTVEDTAGNAVDAAEVTFPAVLKGDQTLSGFQYSTAALTYGSTAPTVTPPTGAQTTLSYSASPPAVCTVNASTGELSILEAGSCIVTVTAAEDANWNQAIATWTVTVQPVGALVLNLGTIADDNTVNIVEKAAGFAILGDTGTEADVAVTVAMGTTELTATSADPDATDGDETATWSVAVPADAAYITGTSVTVSVTASKTGYAAASAVSRTLTVDLTAPTAPSYTAPGSLQVGVAITAILPIGGSGIDEYSAAGLPAGLSIDPSTGVISGTPEAASTDTANVTVTVADTAGNSVDAAVVAFPAVARGDQTLSGFQYSTAALTYGATAPTVTPPTGAQTTLSYSARPSAVCTVNASTGELSLHGAGSCVVTVTAAEDANWNQAIATWTVTVQPAGTLVLNLGTIAGDNTVNIAEKAAGFTIGGDTGTETSVAVLVRIGTSSLTTTSIGGGSTAVWSVNVPANASYITGTSVTVTVTASKTGYAAASAVVRTLTVDLTAPTAPTWTAPPSLQVGVAITAIQPTGGSDIDEYSAAGLPAGLSIDESTGAISGTPTAADTSTAAVTVTVEDTAGNAVDAAEVTFPAVAKGDQTLSGFQYSTGALTYGATTPTVTPPTGAQTTLNYSASPPTVCTVNATTGELSLLGAGSCVVTVTAAADANWNQTSATWTLTIQDEASEVVLTVLPSELPEQGGAASVTLRGRLGGPLLDVDTLVKVAVGAQDDAATAGTDYATLDEVTLTIPAGWRRGRTEFVLTPIDDPIDETEESLTLVGTTEGAGIRVDGTGLTITDDDERGVVVSVTSLTVPEGRSSTYSLVLESQPTGSVTVTPSVGGDTGVTLSPLSLSFTADNWNEPQTVTVEAAGDEDTEDGTTSVTHSVSGADYDAEPAAAVALTVSDSGNPSTRVLLSVDMGSVAEAAGATDVEVTAQLDRGSLEEETQVSVSVGAATDAAVAGTDYAAVDDLTVIIAAGETQAVASFMLEPTNDSLSEPDEAITVSGSVDGSNLSVTATTITIRDDDALNNAPVFPTDLPGVLEVQENTTSGTAIGAPFLATDVDGDTLSYALEGIDASRFSIDPESGQLSTLGAVDHETQTLHSLTVWADDGHGGRAESVLRVAVTDLDEQPDTPAAPTMLATPDTTASLDLRWHAPHRGGGPDIVGYRLQYREGATGTWTDHRHIGVETRATISGLTAATDYQARVQALNGELPGDWSEPGEGATGRADNNAPEFDAGLPATLTVAENTTADTDLGTPLRATDSDGDTLIYLLEGPDRHAFAIASGTGQLSTKAALDHESRATYSLRLRADDGRGGAGMRALTIRVTDIDEQAGTPAVPVVLAARGATTSLEVDWRAPAANGGPAITGYAVQYRAAGADEAVEDGDQIAWTDHSHRGMATRATIPFLDPATGYEVRVRALNGEISGEWSAPGTGRTGVPANTPPAFDKRAVVRLTVDENTPPDVDTGSPLAATDADGDRLTYLLDGAARTAFSIDPESGQLKTRAALNHEAKAAWSLIVRVNDGKGGADTTRVRIAVVDVDEQAPALSAPVVLATANSTTSLDLRWSAPGPGGGPAITGYELQYRAGAEGEWIDHALAGAGTQATIADLAASTDYRARIRALNDEIPGDWSVPGEGRTGRAENTAPQFAADLLTSLRVNENIAADSGIGGPFRATDADNDRLTWLLEDSEAFAIDPDNGQLRTRAALDHEAQDTWPLSIRVSDGEGGANTLAVSVTVVDLAERPARPARPWALAALDSGTGLELRWRAPHDNGGPAIIGYEVQYRAGTDGEWLDHVHQGTDARAHIADLDAATDYQARVRALNGETPSEWSAPGAGNTAGADNGAPEFSDTATTRSVPEDLETGDPVGAPVTATDPDRDRLNYFLEGADADVFEIDPYTGQIRTRAPLDFETNPTLAVRVTANDGNGAAAGIDVSIELIDAQESQAVLGPAAPTGVTLGRSLSLDSGNNLQAGLALRWDAPDTAERPADDITWFEFRLGRFPESSNSLAGSAFQCAGNRPFESDGWRRIPDSGPEGANARSYRFDAGTLGCHVLPDTFELRAQVRAAVESDDRSSTTVSVPSTEARMRDEAPRVMGIWARHSDVSALETGDELVFEVALSEPVKVVATNGSPTLALQLGEETRQAAFAAATRPPAFRNYGSGPIGSRLQFRYTLQDGDNPAAGITVPANAISIQGGASILDATGPAAHAADLRNAETIIIDSGTVLATAAQDSLTAAFEADTVPAAHDGEAAFTLQILFDESDSTTTPEEGEEPDSTTTPEEGEEATPPELPGLVLSEASLLVTGGSVTDVSRVVAGANHLWSIGVAPDSLADVSISLGPTLDCAAAGAVCSDDGRKLGNNIHAVIKGPPTLSVADARVAEAPDATMDFVVTLNRTLSETVSVDYTTSDATATAGEDYSPASGQLTFEPGETSRTVSVAVLDDAHDDDGETFMLTLSNPSGGNVYLLDETATGTIQNADPMPKAWIARFGRSVSEHVLNAIQERLRDRRQQSHITIGGLRLDGLFASGGARAAQSTEAVLGGARIAGGLHAGAAPHGFSATNPGGRLGVGRPFATAPNADAGYLRSAFAGGLPPGGAPGAGSGLGGEPPSLRDILMGSSFYYSGIDGTQDPDAPDSGGLSSWAAWGSVASMRFAGQDGPLSINGEVSSAILGADAEFDRWVAGLTVAHSAGEGEFSHRTASGGTVTSTLISLHPFAQYRFNERTSVWGAIGYGLGDLSLTPRGADSSIDTDLSVAMAALGGRGVLAVRSRESGVFELALRSDAVFTETVSGASENLLSATGATSRLRLAVEGTGSLPLGVGGILTPRLEAGLRYDGGDAETGAGLEIGGALDYSIGRMTLKVSGRFLAAHEDADYEEWGLSGAITWQPKSQGRGLLVNLGSDWGVTQSGVSTLWAGDAASRFNRSAHMDTARRYRAEVGYGWQRGQGGALWNPFLAVESASNTPSLMKTGIKFRSGRTAEASLEVGQRRDAFREREYTIELRGDIRW